MVTEDGHESSRALLVSGRTQGWNGVEKDLTGAQVEGRTVEVTCWMKNNEDRPIVLAATMSEENSSRQVVYNTLVQTQEVAPGAWIQVNGKVQVAEDTLRPILYFESTDDTASFTIDDVVITVS